MHAAPECPPLKASPNGRLIDYEYTNRPSLIGTVVTYQCDSGLFPNDTKSTTCRENGIWSNNPSELMCRKAPNTGTHLIINYASIIILEKLGPAGKSPIFAIFKNR